MKIMELKDISKEYKNGAVVTPALSHITLSVEAGEFIAVMGASGSEKTTLLNILGCMDAPTAGAYYFKGQCLSEWKEKQLSAIRGHKISFVFQNFALIDDYTVYENVEIPLLKRNIPRHTRKEMTERALRAVGISDLSRKHPPHISGGQKQRAAIARAIVCGADVILADEPTGALDSRTGTGIMRIFSELNQSGKTIILITHDGKTAAYADRIIQLADGRIVNDEKI